MHPESVALLDQLLKMLAEEGEAKTFAYARMILKKDRRERWKKGLHSLKELFKRGE